MCGRYTIKSTERIKQEIARIVSSAAADIVPRFNVSPSQTLPVVNVSKDGVRQLTSMRWGLVPFWEKSEKPKIAPINARSEEAMSKPTFRQSLQKRRCLIPADGFYEWQKLTADLKMPMHIQLTGGQPFFFAGLWEHSTETRPQTYALLTTFPNELMKPIHNRMPVILTGEKAARWLAEGALTEEQLVEFSIPFPTDAMEAWHVSRLVNAPRNDSPECVIPADQLTTGGGPNSA